MRSDEFEKLLGFKDKYPEIADLIGKLAVYLEQEMSRPTVVFNPLVVARRLGVDQAAAIVVLGLAEKSGILQRKYQAFESDTNEALEEFTDLGQVGKTIESPDGSKRIPRERFYLDLVFSAVPEVHAEQ